MFHDDGDDNDEMIIWWLQIWVIEWACRSLMEVNVIYTHSLQPANEQQHDNDAHDIDDDDDDDNNDDDQ